MSLEARPHGGQGKGWQAHCSQLTAVRSQQAMHCRSAHVLLDSRSAVPTQYHHVSSACMHAIVPTITHVCCCCAPVCCCCPAATTGATQPGERSPPQRLVSTGSDTQHRGMLWQPADAAGEAESVARQIVTSTAFSLWADYGLSCQHAIAHLAGCLSMGCSIKWT
jgi:hypothetical protein